MLIAWSAIGACLGLHNGFRLGGLISLLAHVVAGLAVFAVLGVILGLFAARPTESLVGAAWGMLVGLVAGPFRGNLPPAEAVNLCVVIGGLVGATCWPWVNATVWVGRALLAAGTPRRSSRSAH